jgi:hypothetical protein
MRAMLGVTDQGSVSKTGRGGVARPLVQVLKESHPENSRELAVGHFLRHVKNELAIFFFDLAQ